MSKAFDYIKFEGMIDEINRKIIIKTSYSCKKNLNSIKIIYSVLNLISKNKPTEILNIYISANCTIFKSYMIMYLLKTV